LGLPGIAVQAQEWLNRYPQLVGISVNRNSGTNAIFGCETRCIAGRAYLLEQFAGLEFQVRSDTFPSLYRAAEALLQEIMQQLNLQGDEVLVDAYCGIGTLTLPLARVLRQAVGLEVQPEAVEQAQVNAQRNGITNDFSGGAVENYCPNGDARYCTARSTRV